MTQNKFHHNCTTTYNGPERYRKSFKYTIVLGCAIESENRFFLRIVFVKNINRILEIAWV